PSAITSPSHFAEEIATARAAFDAHFGISEGANVMAEPSELSEFQTIAVPVILTGLGFFDFPHHQTGVAPNAIELPPGLGIAFQVWGSGSIFRFGRSISSEGRWPTGAASSQPDAYDVRPLYGHQAQGFISAGPGGRSASLPTGPPAR